MILMRNLFTNYRLFFKSGVCFYRKKWKKCVNYEILRETSEIRKRRKSDWKWVKFMKKTSSIWEISHQSRRWKIRKKWIKFIVFTLLIYEILHRFGKTKKLKKKGVKHLEIYEKNLIDVTWKKCEPGSGIMITTQGRSVSKIWRWANQKLRGKIDSLSPTGPGGNFR